MNDELSVQIWSEVPSVYYKASVDAKNRLKLPSRFQDGITNLGNKLFYSSLDGKEIRIYPVAHWNRQLQILEAQQASANPEHALMAKRTLHRAKKFGDYGSMDGEGRIILPQELRQAAGLDAQPAPVRLCKQQDHILVLSEARFLALDAELDVNGEGDLVQLTALGLR